MARLHQPPKHGGKPFDPRVPALFQQPRCVGRVDPDQGMPTDGLIAVKAKLPVRRRKGSE